jgi:hypothetical protein
LVVLGDDTPAVFDTGTGGRPPDALVVRPDGHIAAVLRSDRHGAVALRQALLATAVSAVRPAEDDARA